MSGDSKAHPLIARHFEGKGTAYQIKLNLTSDQVQKFESIGWNIILLKGPVPTPVLAPVWVSTPSAQSLTFDWKENYGIYYSKSKYQAGVTIGIGGHEDDVDMTKGCSYFLDDSSTLFQEQSSGVDSGSVLIQNKSSDDVFGGLSQVVSLTGSRSVAVQQAPITASYLLNKTGQTRAQPLVPFTIGLGGFVQSTLFRKSDLNAGSSFTLDPAHSTISLVFDDSSSTFQEGS